MAAKSNITWAGQVSSIVDVLVFSVAANNLLPSQTFGGNFESDGRLAGAIDIQTVTCDTTANSCQIQVPAPGFALVFLSETVLDEVTPQNQHTFATTVVTKTKNTVTVDPSVLATSNGHGGTKGRGPLGSTSNNALNGVGSVRSGMPAVSMVVFLAMGVGAAMTGNRLM